LLSHFRTQSLSHAALRNFLAQSGLEVTVMANRELMKLESDIAVIEQTLRTIIEMDPTVTEILVESPSNRVPP